ncbi:MAG: cytochrome b5 domain-containing protein [Myxococcota bacterium]
MGNVQLFLEAQARTPPLEGRVSRERGFIPRAPTASSLVSSHAIWDELADDLPRLFVSNRTQTVLERAPSLAAEDGDLPNAELTRAAVVLSALAHAYWRFGIPRFYPQRTTQIPNELPRALLVPWRSVVRRLGRHEPERPFQNFYDLFLANYRLRPGLAQTAPLIIENMEVLVPSFENEAERVFYMSFVEMHFHLAPLVSAVCEIETALERQDDDAIVHALASVVVGLERATAVWQKIGARTGSRVCCDPVLWSKTAAILGVPPEGTPQGATSGACAPMLYVLDRLLGRTSYESRYGQFVWNHVRYFIPRPVRDFADHVAALQVPRYASERPSAKVTEALAAVAGAYCGERGWLGRHASKVFNYLCVSTITGRNASVSGDERYFGEQTWVHASAELHESRIERGSARCPFAANHTASPKHSERRVDSRLPDRSLPAYTRLEVARHFRDDDLWLIIDAHVHDVSAYLHKHPGGASILKAYAGQDVTSLFWQQVLHDAPFVRAQLERCVIGRVVADQGPFESQLYQLVCTLIRCYQSSKMQYDHALGGQLALKLFSDEHAHMLLLEENLPVAYELLAPNAWQRLAAEPTAARVRADAQRLSSEFDFSGSLSPALVTLMQRRCELLREVDLALLERLLTLTFAAGSRRHQNPETPSTEAVINALAQTFRRELKSYFDRLAS